MVTTHTFYIIFYIVDILGTLHGVGSATSTGGVVGSTVGPSLGYIGRRLQVNQITSLTDNHLN